MGQLDPRPAEELYDLEADADEAVNLAGDPRYAEVLAGMRRSLSEWATNTGDVVPERISPDEFDRETGDQLPNRVLPRPTKPTNRSGGVSKP